MRATIRFGLALLAGLLLVGAARTARGQDTLDDVKRRLKLEADKVEAEVREGLDEAEKQAKKSTAEAIKTLEYMQVKLEITRALSPERKAELQRQLDARIRYFRQAATNGGLVNWEERARQNREQMQSFEQKQREMRQLSGQIAEMYRQGKHIEALQLNQKYAEKFGPGPSTLAAGRMATARKTLDELRGLREEKDARYPVLMAQLIKSSMPIVEESGMEFPKDWRAKTKLRTQVKLTPEEAKLLKALGTPITLELKNQPLQGVIDDFEKRYGIKFELDKPSLDQLMITLETTPVSVRARETTLRSVIKQMLGELNLTYVIVRGQLHVMTPEKASNFMRVQTYYVGDLVNNFGFAFDPFGINQLQAVQNIAALIQQIKSIEPQTWVDGGGQGTIAFNPATMSIIVKQSAEMHYSLRGAMPR